MVLIVGAEASAYPSQFPFFDRRGTLSAGMVNRKIFIFPILLAFLAASVLAAEEPEFDPLPAPLSNNAVATIKSRGEWLLYSFMGIGAKKTWDSVSNDAYVVNESGKWAQARSVPGSAGRLAAGAVGGRDHIFLFGGYVIDGQGGEITLPDVNVYDPLSDRWFRGADIPVPVDDFVLGMYHDRFIYLVSGWSKDKTVQDVQMYDAEKNVWASATPVSGAAVFGHSGALLNDTIVYVDGAYRNPEESPSSSRPTSVGWERSTAKIQQKPSGASYPTIRELRGIASQRAALRKMTKFISRGVQTIPTTTTEWATTENLRRLRR